MGFRGSILLLGFIILVTLCCFSDCGWTSCTKDTLLILRGPQGTIAGSLAFLAFINILVGGNRK